VDGAPLTNPSPSNFDLFWTQTAIYFRTERPAFDGVSKSCNT